MSCLNLDEENKNFANFIASETVEVVFLQNKLSIHIETVNIYYEILNTNVSIYYFLQQQQQQDKTKKLSMWHSALMIPF